MVLIINCIICGLAFVQGFYMIFTVGKTFKLTEVLKSAPLEEGAQTLKRADMKP